jgi:hypothetical protein
MAKTNDSKQSKNGKKPLKYRELIPPPREDNLTREQIRETIKKIIARRAATG